MGVGKVAPKLIGSSSGVARGSAAIGGFFASLRRIRPWGLRPLPFASSPRPAELTTFRPPCSSPPGGRLLGFAHPVAPLPDPQGGQLGGVGPAKRPRKAADPAVKGRVGTQRSPPERLGSVRRRSGTQGVLAPNPCGSAHPLLESLMRAFFESYSCGGPPVSLVGPQPGAPGRQGGKGGAEGPAVGRRGFG